MFLKRAALCLYKILPDILQRRIVRILYPGYVIAAKAFITNADGKFLVVENTYRPNWDIPSGHCDPGESPDQTAVRELWEETGIKVERMQQTSVIFYPALRTLQVLFVHALDNSPEPVADGVEISDVRWVERGEVTLNPYAEEALEVILNHKASYWVSVKT